MRCPRCGYDLRGELSRWTERCPLEGVCTECGLDVRWMELLSPTMRHPAWCVELGGAWRLPWRWLATTCKAIFHPWRFWTELRLSHTVRWRGLLLYLLGWLVAAYLLLTLAVVVTFTMVDHRAPTSLRDLNLVSLGSVLAAPWWPKPLQATQSGIVTSAPATWGNAPPSLVRWNAVAPWLFFASKAPFLLLLMLEATVMMGASAATFLALPVTRRRCKVRMAHAWRVAVYGAALWVPAMLTLPLGDVLLAFGFEGLATRWAARAILGATVLLTFVWWAAATKRYLRMPHAWAVAAASVVVGVLSTALLLVKVVPQQVISL